MPPAARAEPGRVIRTCVGCRKRAEPSELVRFVVDGRGVLRGGRLAPGRGAWLCPNEDCWAQAAKRRAWSRALRRAVIVPAGRLDAQSPDGFRDGARAD